MKPINREKWMCPPGNIAPHFLWGSTLWESCRYPESCQNPPGSLVLAGFHSCLQIKKTDPRSFAFKPKEIPQRRARIKRPSPYARCWWSRRFYGGRQNSWSCPLSSWSAQRGCSERTGSWFSTWPCRWGTRWFFHLLLPMPVNRTERRLKYDDSYRL